MDHDSSVNSKTKILHGGDVYRNAVRLDFSVNLNPAEIPHAVKEECAGALGDLRQYPDPLQQGLRTAIAEMDGVSAEDVICGNGASELIMAAAHALMPKKALITAPCYAGYRVALEANGTEIREHALAEENGFALTEDILGALTEDLDLVILGDPNNPSGRLIDPSLLGRIRNACAAKGITLMTDECFLPLTGRGTEAPAEDDLSIHLRAFTKTFAVPALRLGYLVCRDRDLLGRIGKHLPEWNVSLIAERAGIAAAGAGGCSSGFIRASVRTIERERRFLSEELRSLGIRVFPSDTAYLLLRTDPRLKDRLLENGILVRDCSGFSGLGDGYIRIAVRNREDNMQLLAAVKEALR